MWSKINEQGYDIKTHKFTYAHTSSSVFMGLQVGIGQAKSAGIGGGHLEDENTSLSNLVTGSLFQSSN